PGTNATAFTCRPWAESVSAEPLEIVHTRTVLSLEPEATRAPSGENATEVTSPVCPVNTWTRPCPIWPPNIAGPDDDNGTRGVPTPVRPDSLPTTTATPWLSSATKLPS